MKGDSSVDKLRIRHDGLYLNDVKLQSVTSYDVKVNYEDGNCAELTLKMVVDLN